MRHYYDGDMPNIIQVAEHQYVEHQLINMWTTAMNVAWWVEALMLLSLFNTPLTGSRLPTVHERMKLLLLGLIASQLAGLSKQYLTVPHLFLQESSHSSGILVESTGIQ